MEFFPSFIASIFVGGAAGYLGSLMVSRRMALVGDALGHVALPGMGLALLLGIDVSIGAFLFLVLGTAIVWFYGQKTEIPAETLVGVVFVASLALGFLIVPELELLEALFGDISRVTLLAASLAILTSVFVVFILKKNYANLVLAGISEDLAKVQKIKTWRLDLDYLFLIAIVVALGVKVTGSLLVGALVIVPAAAMRNIATSLKLYAWGSMFLGALSAAVGVILYKYTGYPAGPMIVLTSVLIFGVSFILRKR